MRKLVLITFLSAAFSFHSEAQDAGPRRFHAGITGGTQVFGKTYADDNLRPASGLVAGVDVSYAFGKSKSGFSIHFQPNYAGFNRKDTNGDRSDPFYAEHTWKWKAWNAPILLRYTMLPGPVRPFIEAGANFRFRKSLSVHNQGYVCGFAGCFVIDNFIDLQPQTSKDIVGITAGVGVEVDVWKVTIPVSIRITDQAGEYKMKQMLADSYYYEGLKTQTVQVTAGIVF